jgi:hypothetical protein
MVGTKSMIVTGRELQVISAARLIYLEVPFKSGKVPLGKDEWSALDQLGDRALAVRDSLVPRPWSDADRALMQRSTTEFDLSEGERSMLVDVLTRILVDFESESSIQPYLPRIKRGDLEQLLARLAALRHQ